MRVKITDAAGATARLTPPLTLAEHTPPMYGSDRWPMADLKAAYKAPAFARIYGGAGMPSAAELNSVPASVRLLHVSYKGTTQPAAVRASLQAAQRPGRRIVIETLHEMDRAVKNGGPTATAYHQNYQPLSDVVKALDPTGEQIGLIQTFMGWAQRHAPDRAWRQFARDDVDLIGVDIEWDSTFGSSAYPTPAALQAIALQIRDAHPAKAGLIYPEFAWPQLASDTSGTGLADFYIEHCDYADDNDLVAVGIYDFDGSTGKYRLPDGSPAFAAVQKVIG
jgi:hypothetical protein